jgi:hypothetical protein
VFAFFAGSPDFSSSLYITGTAYLAIAVPFLYSINFNNL